MTEALFATDSYIKAFEAQVMAHSDEEHGLILDRSAFFPGGGGQPCDTGFIEYDGQRLTVVKVKRISGDIVHFVEGALPLPGVKVTGTLDWQRRYQLMRTHTALHILCGVIWRDYQAQVTGGNMEPLRGRLDFEFETLQAELIHEIEAKINTEVQNDRKVTVNILSREAAFKIPDLIRTKINLLPESLKEIRTIEIEGLDLQADGGTHVNRTGEVGRIQIAKYKSKGKINKRIEIRLEP